MSAPGAADDGLAEPVADSSRNGSERPGVSVTVRAGDNSAAVDLDRLRGMERERIEREYLCASGERWIGVWRGVPVSRVLDAAAVDLDADATHLRVAAAGDYAVCVPVTTALDAHLAVERDGDSIPPDRGPRFLAPVDAGKTVKAVRNVTLLELDAGDDPQKYEELNY
ncbi:molybdopterin-dependent oxidoreductase (plasmid) [Halobaculum sp. CBA1158]|uniref:molybdopterin-dependent oxidoreductase n=1 Tax=Halobaculum sp. CBA1158 TaxID=2904243 RepID=UPI001F1BE16A|nr:molybdopterin-dependent oxidoreductase [Halobaculum sp. CBA1158]UIP01439.1 molybdopterin-dependent oxidoreductase [Halobaculum sp. CBA1158]